MQVRLLAAGELQVKSKTTKGLVFFLEICQMQGNTL
jgi:hypothetical protein